MYFDFSQELGLERMLATIDVTPGNDVLTLVKDFEPNFRY